MSESNSPGTGEEVAVMHTNLGDITLRLFPDQAPKHVQSFKKLARSESSDGPKSHAVTPGFMIQGGDPNPKSDDRSRHGTGGPGYTVPAEFNSTPHERGILSADRKSVV